MDADEFQIAGIPVQLLEYGERRAAGDQIHRVGERGVLFADAGCVKVVGRAHIVLQVTLAVVSHGMRVLTACSGIGGFR